MENPVKPKIIVTDDPPWYSEQSSEKDVFACKSTEDLFDSVASLMVAKQRDVTALDQGYRAENLNKIIREKAIHDCDTISQEPSHSLLLALMDLVDILGGNELECMSHVDKSGLKHVILAHTNYTMYYIPTKDLMSKGKRVIPVVAEDGEKEKRVYYDKARSLIGTYMVSIQATADQSKAYFIQEVLYVPGRKSLKLLREVVGDRFEFWDMSLEVPSHITALTPAFQQIQPFQILSTENKNSCAQGEMEALSSHMEDVHPMCVLRSTSYEKKKRDASVDCFTEPQVLSDLTQFEYANGAAEKTVYLRRHSKFLQGMRVNLILAVKLRPEQSASSVLYASTTVRFCRAVKHLCIKGSSELVSHWSEVMTELNRNTFITGPEMYQEIHCQALASFTRRVNQNSWCNPLPKHIESTIADPKRIEMLELAIRFMDCKIPRSFAVAEVLYSSRDKVKDYVKLWNDYSSDSSVRKTLTNQRVSVLDAQIRKAWADLAKLAILYTKCVCRGNVEILTQCKKVFKNLDNVITVQKRWYPLIKHNLGPGRNKEFEHMYLVIKVLFLKLRTYQAKMKKVLQAAERGQVESPPPTSLSLETTDTGCHGGELDGRSRSLHNKQAPETATTSTRGQQPHQIESLPCIIIPEHTPLSPWIKNLSVLLLSGPWLNQKDPIRRDAVCTLLGLDKTLLDKRHARTLQDWVNKNRTVVTILKSSNLNDRLSTALVKCLESTSTMSWKSKVIAAFREGNENRSRIVTAERSKKSEKYRKMRSDELHAKKVGSGRTSSTYSESREDCLLLNEAEEASTDEEEGEDEENAADEANEIPGEDLLYTEWEDDDYDDDQYDEDDADFIDDGPILEDPESSEEAEDYDTFCKQIKKKRRQQQLGQRKTRILNRYDQDSSCSDSNEDAEAMEEQRAASHTGKQESKPGKALYKRTLTSSDESDASDDNAVRPAKRVKRAKSIHCKKTATAHKALEKRHSESPECPKYGACTSESYPGNSGLIVSEIKCSSPSTSTSDRRSAGKLHEERSPNAVLPLTPQSKREQFSKARVVTSLASPSPTKKSRQLCSTSDRGAEIPVIATTTTTSSAVSPRKGAALGKGDRDNGGSESSPRVQTPKSCRSPEGNSCGEQASGSSSEDDKCTSTRGSQEPPSSNQRKKPVLAKEEAVVKLDCLSAQETDSDNEDYIISM